MVQSLLTASLSEASTIAIAVRGRKTGRERRALLWFAYVDDKVYLLAHKEVQWWRNLEAEPGLKLMLGNQVIQGVAKIVPEKMELIYQFFREKYGDQSVERWYGDSQSNRVPFEVEILKRG